MANPARTRPEITVHPATGLLREILELTAAFQLHLGKELSVNQTDLDAMEELIKDGPLSPTELAGRLNISTAAVTTVVDRLTAVGHVSRMPNPDDRRGVIIVPAPASVAKAMQTLMPMILSINEVLAGFSEEEKTTITVYLDRVVSAYRGHLPDMESAD